MIALRPPRETFASKPGNGNGLPHPAGPCSQLSPNSNVRSFSAGLLETGLSRAGFRLSCLNVDIRDKSRVQQLSAFFHEFLSEARLMGKLDEVERLEKELTILRNLHVVLSKRRGVAANT